jgi:major membrane immunogen (membrane-anchored lipoprotein)
MYRFLAIMALVMSVFLLSACGDSDSTSSTTTTASQTIAQTDRISLAWTPPTTRSDGSFLEAGELAGYRIYMGTKSNNLAPLVDLSDDSITQYTVSDLPSGNYYFAISAFDTDGLESSYSQVILVQLS